MLTDERLDEIGTCLERANSVYPISAFAAYCEARNALTEHAAEYLEDLYDEVCRLKEELRETRIAAAKDMQETFRGNIQSVSLIGLNALDIQPVLMAVQSWDISTGRARELIRCWILGTFSPDMLPPCKDLGLAEDDDPGDVLLAARKRVAELTEANEELHNLVLIYRNDNPTA